MLGSTLIFTDKRCMIWDHLQKNPPLLLSDLHNGLYALSTSSLIASTDAKACVSVVAVEKAKLWHLRLGHLPFQQIKLLNPDYDIKNYVKTNVCQIGALARQTRFVPK